MRIFLFTFLFFILCTPAYGLKINEIYPAPLQGSFEWVELYNESDQTINLLEYVLTDETGKSLVFATQSASAQSYIIATSSGVLNNAGDTAILKTNSGILLEQVLYPANIDSQQSYSFCENTLWTIQTATQGTTNTSCRTPTLTPTVEPTNKPTPAPTSESSPIPTTPIQNVFINEYMPNPSDGPEWVELYNGNDADIMLADWYIDDAENAGSSAYMFSVLIEKYGFAIIQLKSSMLNNTGDSLRLLNSSKQEINTTTYTASTENKSISKQKNGSWCVAEESSGYENFECFNTNVTNTANISPSPTVQLLKSEVSALPHAYPIVTLSLQFSSQSKQHQSIPRVLGAQTAQLPQLFYFFALLSCVSACVSGSLFALHFKRE